MTDSDEEPEPPEAVPEELITKLDALDRSELKAVESYVEALIDTMHPPLEEEIEATAAGEVLDIEKHGGYALVRKHPPNPDGPGVDSNIISVYHVRRERHPDGEEDLNWAYIGDIQDSDESR
jgi:hypothetical protein